MATDYTILSAPRISEGGFRRLLELGRSPSARDAGACYAAFVAAGVDPAVGLAVFRKESTYGRFGRAARNRSWGNIRDPQRDGIPYPNDSGGFRIYPTWAEGARDCARLLAVYGRNAIRRGVDTSTVQRMPFVWAPSSDGNAPDRYGDQLASWIAAWERSYPPSSTPAPAPAPGVRRYRVQAGDSLWAIASRFYGRGALWPRIYAANRATIGRNPSLIRPGQLLTIPAG